MKKEKEIVRHLIDNPRASYVEIAKELRISPETVRQNVLKLVKEGKVRLYCVPDFRYFGKRRITMVLSVPVHEKVSIMEKLREIPQTIEMRSGVLSNTVIMDICTKDADLRTNELMKTFKKLGVEVKEIFESEWVHFDSRRMIS